MAGKFSKAMVTTAPDKSASKNILTGPPNTGKTYFASTIDNVFIIPVEEGLKGASQNHSPGHFKVVPETLADLHDALTTFEREINVPPNGDRAAVPYRHLAIDSLSGIEMLVHAEACRSEGAKHMEAADYKKIWHAAEPLWLGVRGAFDRIRRGGVHIWVLAHAIEEFSSDPLKGDVFRCWDLMLKGTGKTLADTRHLWRPWADNVFYLIKTHDVKKGSKDRRATSQFRGRVLITQETGGFMAKSRGNLPPTLPATWADLKRAWATNAPASPEKLIAQIQVLLPSLNADDKAQIEQDLEQAKSPTQLSAVLSRAQGMAEVASQERSEATSSDAEEPPKSGERGPAGDMMAQAAEGSA